MGDTDLEETFPINANVHWSEELYDWATGKNMMQDLNAFINGLINFPKDTLKEEVLLKFRKHRFDPKVCFKPEEIKARVGPAADLCTWCIAMDTYASVSKKVIKLKIHIKISIRWVQKKQK